MMAEASIPVDLLNPGQVFACLGFMEAAEILLGNAEGGFDWSDESDVRFRLRANGSENPVAVVLQSLATAKVTEMEPRGWPGERDLNAIISAVFPSKFADHYIKSDKKWSRTKLPARLTLEVNNLHFELNLYGWSDGSSRPDFKLYAGNRTGTSIAHDMVFGKRAKPTKRNPDGKLETLGVAQLWDEFNQQLVDDSFGVTCPLGGTFNMDPRGGWVALDLGFSPNEQKNVSVVSSPVVEILAILGVEHARPNEYETRKVQYAAWSQMIPPILARAALAGHMPGIELRQFRFHLELSGKNKVVTFAEPDGQSPM